MSYRKHSYLSYNRAEDKENFIKFIDSLFHEDIFPHQYDGYDDYYDFSDWFMTMDGYVHDSNEYHKMKVLTLLHFIYIKSATEIVIDRGW